jgi:hypothetical protein
MKKYICILLLFITTTSYKESDKISLIQERLLIEKSLNHTEQEIEKINKILNNKYHKSNIK